MKRPEMKLELPAQVLAASRKTMSQATPNRRQTLLGGAALGGLAWASTATANDANAWGLRTRTGKLEIAVVPPQVNTTCYGELRQDPVYNWSRRQVQFYASLPGAFTLKNVDSHPIARPKGHLDVSMRDRDSLVFPVIRQKVRPFAADSYRLRLRSRWAPSSVPHAGAYYSWEYYGTIAPGQTVTVPLKYQAAWGMVNVPFTLLVSVWANKDFGGGTDAALGQGDITHRQPR